MKRTLEINHLLPASVAELPHRTGLRRTGYAKSRNELLKSGDRGATNITPPQGNLFVSLVQSIQKRHSHQEVASFMTRKLCIIDGGTPSRSRF
jgi:hypothetical protein